LKRDCFLNDVQIEVAIRKPEIHQLTSGHERNIVEVAYDGTLPEAGSKLAFHLPPYRFPRIGLPMRDSRGSGKNALRL
jgi:hypothetical protein